MCGQIEELHLSPEFVVQWRASEGAVDVGRRTSPAYHAAGRWRQKKYNQQVQSDKNNKQLQSIQNLNSKKQLTQSITQLYWQNQMNKCKQWL